MATSARFGRLPRSAPSLTSTIVALAQEYQRIRDTNIETAWKNGGLFEGKKVTDDMIIKHWTDRRNSVGQGDPMWDYYNNLLNGYEFQIDESTQYLKYKQGKIGEAQMAAVYVKWAKKMPVDSENYRQLMLKAAQFRAAAASRGSGGSARASRDAYYAAQQNTYDEYEAGWQILTDSVMNLAVQYGLIDPEDQRGSDGGWFAWNKENAGAGGVGAEADAENMASMIYQLNNDPAWKTVRDQLTAQIKRVDPGFSGNFSEADLARLQSRAWTGASTRARRAVKAGDKTGAKDANKALKVISIQGYVTRSSDFVLEDQRRKGVYDAVLADPTASPLEKWQANREYREWLATDGIRMVESDLPPGSWQGTSPNYDPQSAGVWSRVVGNINALDGKPSGNTTWDDPYATSTKEQGSTSEAARVGNTAAGLYSGISELATGKSVLVQADPEGNPTGDPSSYAIIERDDPRLAGAAFVVVPAPAELGTGGWTSIAIVPRDVEVRIAKTVDPNTGEAIDTFKTPGESGVIGKTLTYVAPGGRRITLYGTYVNQELKWTEANPLVDGLRTAQGGDAGKLVITVDGTGGDITKIGDVVDRTRVEQFGYASPAQAFYRANDQNLSTFNGVSEAAFKQAEYDYFVSHPTAKMIDLQSRGATLEQAASQEANESYNSVYIARMYGNTPEQRAQAFEGMRLMAEARVAGAVEERKAKEERTKKLEFWQTKTQRDELVTQIEAWRASQKPVAGTVPTAGPTALPKGYTVGDLINNPDISYGQAMVIARYLTNDKVGATPAGMAYAAPTPQRGLLGQPLPAPPPTGWPTGPKPPTSLVPTSSPTPTATPKPTTAPTPKIVPRTQTEIDKEYAAVNKASGGNAVKLPGGEIGVRKGDRIAY
jgi:hypothetical protein